MTVPSLTANGYMHWPLRAWVESLCAPQPDGTWLVQAPITGKQEPRLYLLPDAKTKDRYLWWATARGWLYVLRELLSPLFGALVGIMITLQLITGPGDDGFLAVLLIIYILWPLAYAVTFDRLLGLLPDARQQSAENWLRQGVVVRSAAEWDAIYLSRGLALAFITTWLTIGLFVALGMLFVVTNIDRCGRAAILGGTLLEIRPLDTPEASFICRSLYGWLVGAALLVATSCASLIRWQQKWRAGRARLLRSEGDAARPAEAHPVGLHPGAD